MPPCTARRMARFLPPGGAAVASEVDDCAIGAYYQSGHTIRMSGLSCMRTETCALLVISSLSPHPITLECPESLKLDATLYQAYTLWRLTNCQLTWIARSERGR